MSLGIGESSDHLSPICMVTDWGIALAFFICPRLVNIVIRNAPYLNDITRWFSAGFCDEESLHIRPTIVPSSASEDCTQPAADCQENSTQTCVTDKPSKTYFLPLRSLTLENCPGISLEVSLELDNYHCEYDVDRRKDFVNILMQFTILHINFVEATSSNFSPSHY